jgi:hypothetical protein
MHQALRVWKDVVTATGALAKALVYCGQLVPSMCVRRAIGSVPLP